MDIYEELITQVENGNNFSINFQKRDLKINKKYIIKDGEILEGYELNKIKYGLETIEKLYADYYYSCPSEKSESNRNVYFKALRPKEMTDEQLICGTNRELARAKLEGVILCEILNGFKWKEEFGKWYWKSKKYKDFIILREWIEGGK